MFSKIVVASNDLPESQRALCTAIDLARSCNAELATVSILGDPPAFSSFSAVVDSSAPAALMEEQRDHQKQMHEKAAKPARELDIDAQGSIVVGKEVRVILRFLKERNADSFVVALHQHDFYLSRLWNSIYDLAEDATCSVLGVH
jgi:nucleotide-binding universal stress UspA family protein